MVGGSPPKAYNPTGQPAQDANINNAIQQLLTNANNLQSSVATGYGNVWKGITNDPYYGEAMQGAQKAASQAPMIASQEEAQAAQLAQLAQASSFGVPTLNSDLQLGQQAYGQAQAQMPAAAQSIQSAYPVLQQGLNNAATSWGESQGALGLATQGAANQFGAGNQILQTAFDPQMALYNRQYQQMMEQANAINAQNGVAGSPFAAGLNAQDASNFNIDWQNQQLARQTQGLSAYDSAVSSGLSNINSTLSTGASDYAGLTNSAVGDYSSLLSGGIGDLLSLLQGGMAADTGFQAAGENAYSTAVNSAATAGNASAGLDQQALQTLVQGAQAPNQVYMGQQNALLNAVNAFNQGETNAMSPTQQAIADALAYMGVGQGATSLNQNAWQQKNAQQQGFFGGLADLGGLALAPFTGGGSLALLGAGGGIGGLFGGG